MTYHDIFRTISQTFSSYNFMLCFYQYHAYYHIDYDKSFKMSKMFSVYHVKTTFILVRHGFVKLNILFLELKRGLVSERMLFFLGKWKSGRNFAELQ